MNALTIRSLNPEELIAFQDIANKFNLPSIYRLPDVFKILRIEICCILCHHTDLQYVKMDKYSDNTWLMDRTIREQDVEGLPDTFCVTISYCNNCFSIKQTPQQIRAANFYHKIIGKQYSQLLKIYRAKGITKIAIYDTIRASAKRAALCYGRPDTWRDYVPNDLKGQFEEGVE